MLEIVLTLLIAPALVGVSSLASRRLGERIGGLVSAFPAIVGPVLLITAHEHGAMFAAAAANGTLLGAVVSLLVVEAGVTAAFAAAVLAALLTQAAAVYAPLRPTSSSRRWRRRPWASSRGPRPRAA